MKPLIKLSVPIAFYLLTTACNYTGNKSQNLKTSDSAATENTNNAITDNAYEKQISTSTGKILVIKESHPRGASLSDITITFKNDSSSALSVYDKDPIARLIVADLDSNGFDELYIITTAVGSGSYSNVVGLASNKDKSLSFINFPDIEEKDIQKGGFYYGYEGHDTFYIEQKHLVRSFPVNNSGENKKKLAYRLQKTETGYVLILVS